MHYLGLAAWTSAEAAKGVLECFFAGFLFLFRGLFYSRLEFLCALAVFGELFFDARGFGLGGGVWFFPARPPFPGCAIPSGVLLYPKGRVVALLGLRLRVS